MTTSIDGVAVRECAYCGNEFQPSKHGGRAKYCTPAHRQAAYNERRRLTKAAEPEAPPEGRVEALVAAVRSHLEVTRRLDSIEGLAALALADRIDRSSPLDSGQSLAALVRELRATLAAMTATPVEDPVGALRLVT